ncbi:hypothetical protein Pcinc_036342 [Petrolisthes cinctipes]|uniref:Uncharacterized protein n=1 Tax=Petrolisthes cinctipes TaxID=88211 RepID=A0AAE1BVW0_PETCI|nr:hypothetical protein Pcinc_036342 [Petrolisthes cinctipes]
MEGGGGMEGVGEVEEERVRGTPTPYPFYPLTARYPYHPTPFIPSQLGPLFPLPLLYTTARYPYTLPLLSPHSQVLSSPYPSIPSQSGTPTPYPFYPLTARTPLPPTFSIPHSQVPLHPTPSIHHSQVPLHPTPSIPSQLGPLFLLYPPLTRYPPPTPTMHLPSPLPLP